MLGWDDHWEGLAAELDGRPGRVVRQDRGWVQVARSSTDVDSSRTRADRVGTPVVGDWVLTVDDEVAVVLERRNALRRADPVGEGAQVLASNLDQVLVVLGLDRPVKSGRIQRAVVQAWDADAEPIIVLTKADLHDHAADERARVEHQHPGVDVVAVSSHVGTGVDPLREHIRGRMVVLLGESGAGKSSLLNALADGSVAQIGDVREADAKGRHTTTRRELHLLSGGGLVVDTPGVRAVGLFADPDAVDAAFPDVVDVASQCRFNDCSHEREPGCAVQAAIEAGDLPADRLDAYVTMHAEAEWAQLPDHERRRRR